MSGYDEQRGYVRQSVPVAEQPSVEALVDQINWFVACLEDRIAGKPVRGLAEAEAGYDAALDSLTAALERVERERDDYCKTAQDHFAFAAREQARAQKAEAERDGLDANAKEFYERMNAAEAVIEQIRKGAMTGDTLAALDALVDEPPTEQIPEAGKMAADAALLITAGTPCKSCGDKRRPETLCSHCGGHGLVHGYEGDPTECSTCWGSGEVWPPYCRGCSKFRSMKGWL